VSPGVAPGFPADQTNVYGACPPPGVAKATPSQTVLHPLFTALAFTKTVTRLTTVSESVAIQPLLSATVTE